MPNEDRPKTCPECGGDCECDERTLVIPDIRTEVAGLEEAIDYAEVDYVVCLGNYFHAVSGDTVEANAEAARWLKTSLWTPHRTHLLSANDLQYVFPEYDFLRRPSFNAQISLAINEILTDMDWRAMDFHFWVDGCLLSSAGIDVRGLPSAFRRCDAEYVAEFLSDEEDDAWEALLRSSKHWLCDASGKYGGAVHATALRHPIPGITQIHGDLAVVKPTRAATSKGSAACFATIQAGDTYPPHMALLHDGDKMTIIHPSGLREDDVKFRDVKSS